MAKKSTRSNEVGKTFNTFLRDVMYEGKATCQFNIDKRQLALSDDLKKSIKALGFNYQHKEHYYYKQTKSASFDSKAYKALKAQVVALFDNDIFENVVMPEKSSPKTSKATKSSKKTSAKAKVQSSEKTEIKSAKDYKNKTAKKVAKATSSTKVEPKAQPVVETKSQDNALLAQIGQIGKALESLTASITFLNARMDALEDAQ